MPLQHLSVNTDKIQNLDQYLICSSLKRVRNNITNTLTALLTVH